MIWRKIPKYNLIFNCSCMKKFTKLVWKIIFVLASLCLGLIQKKEGILNMRVPRHDPDHGITPFSILKNANGVWKTWNLAWCPHKTSRGYGRNSRSFGKSCDISCLEMFVNSMFEKTNLGFERQQVQFEGEATIVREFKNKSWIKKYLRIWKMLVISIFFVNS